MKFLIILLIIVYVLYKLASFFFKVGAASQHMRQYQQQRNQPQKPEPKKDRNGKIQGGEYVEYEEVK